MFCTFYIDLYSANVHPTKAEIAAFLDSCFLLRLSSSDMQMLNAPLTEKEHYTDLKQAPNRKSPGDDGLPSEVYR